MNHMRMQWLATVLILGSKVAVAGTVVDALAVSATISPNCAVTTSPVNFGPYNPASRLMTPATGLVVITCTEDTFYDIALDAGVHPLKPGDVTSRQMARTEHDHDLPYALFVDSARMTLWSSQSSHAYRAGTHAGSGAAHHYPVYGRIGAARHAAGPYADTVIATLTYH